MVLFLFNWNWNWSYFFFCITYYSLNFCIILRLSFLLFLVDIATYLPLNILHEKEVRTRVNLALIQHQFNVKGKTFSVVVVVIIMRERKLLEKRVTFFFLSTTFETSWRYIFFFFYLFLNFFYLFSLFRIIFK